jgi:hypothetical protein
MLSNSASIDGNVVASTITVLTIGDFGRNIMVEKACEAMKAAGAKRVLLYLL